ncbi:hypothetical protein CDD83_1446 [Cordyceps sp. RAO-2017]|nr:hypothetical protein CDD83_1446 [Cordyceps sp. RAO-2017]
MPYSARPLVKSDLQAFEPVFVHYLGIQKQKNAYEMDEREIRGRWKSFMGKWNRNELAEGWYDPEMFSRISTWETEEMDEDEEEEEEGLRRPTRDRSSGAMDTGTDSQRPGAADDDDDDDDEDDDDDDVRGEDEDYGPALPQSSSRRRVGANIPSLQDLSLRDELIQESREEEREALRAERKADRALQKERLEELAPRAEPGSRERKLEKRRETNDKMRQFRDRSPGMEAGNDKDLMGGGDSFAEFKQLKAKERRRKSERQVRREEIDRAKREMMESKRKAWQAREEDTVGMLRELAKQRFG